jgi:glyoxylase-like metal-dependent hydrolase (beta-lactamase superfamily II)
MKYLHRSDLRAWSSFDVARDVDFNSVAWIRDGGNVLIDPMPMIESDLAQLIDLGGADVIVITNSDHARASVTLGQRLSARLCGPAAEKSSLGIDCDRWLRDGDEIAPGLEVFELNGSKTPGELALLLEGSTLVTGDLVRGQRAGSLNLLPDAKLGDKSAALESVRRLAAIASIDAVLVGDGWPVFHGGAAALSTLVANARET